MAILCTDAALYSLPLRITAEAERRFWTKVQVGEGCWLWTAGLTPAGYGKFWMHDDTVLAHRVAYEIIKGPVPKGWTLDHVCRVRRCVRPHEEHCDPATQRTNTLRSPIAPAAVNARKTHCPQGHEYTEANTYWTKPPRRQRMCRTCFRLRAMQRRRASGMVRRVFTTRAACPF